MNLNHFDLNLLFALDMLLRERSVTRAADKLCITQPALSGSLRRLRNHFNDQLLVRMGHEMELTPKALALVAPVREALILTRSILEAHAVFEPRTTKRTFRIAMSDFCAHIYLPHVVRKLMREAPGTRCVVETVFSSSFERLQKGDIDLIVTHSDWRLFFTNNDPASLISAPLFRDDFVCVVAKDHPIKEEMTIEDFQRYPHAVANFGSTMLTVEEAALAQLGIKIDNRILVPTFSGTLYQIPETQLLATIQRSLAKLMASHLAVRILEPPVKLPCVDETLFWHQRSDNDPGHKWMCELMIAAATQI
jgi:LysR family nod box-dependent transcriptional activator